MRESLGLTMEEFAARLKVAMNTVSRWENSRPPTGPSLERLYRFAKRNGPASSAETLLAAITSEKKAEFRRYRTAEIMNAENLQHSRDLLRGLWKWVEENGTLRDTEDTTREFILALADRWFLGGRKEFLGEDEQ